MIHCPTCGASVPDNATICPQCGSPLTSTSQTLPRGTLLAQQYRIEAVLGQGGFGITYRALPNHNTRPVAIKELFPSGATRRGQSVMPPSTYTAQEWQEAQRGFRDEAQLLRQLNHPTDNPNIVDVFNSFQENNTAYLVMEYLQGESLESRLNKGPLPPQEVLGIARGLVSALKEVHSVGPLHRDIKPANIYLTPEGRAVLIDFGSARAFTAGKTMHLTRLITPGYAPPEQYSSSARFGPYTDVYALGATLYHALTGVMPPSSVDIMQGQEPKPLPRGTPDNLRELITQAMQIRVEDRPQDAGALKTILEEQPLPHQPGNPTQPAPTPPFWPPQPSPAPRSPAPHRPVPNLPARKSWRPGFWGMFLMLAAGLFLLLSYIAIRSGPSTTASAETKTTPDTSSDVTPDQNASTASNSEPLIPPGTSGNSGSANNTAKQSPYVAGKYVLLKDIKAKAGAPKREQGGYFPRGEDGVVYAGALVTLKRRLGNIAEVTIENMTYNINFNYLSPLVSRKEVDVINDKLNSGKPVTLGAGFYNLYSTNNKSISIKGAGQDKTWVRLSNFTSSVYGDGLLIYDSIDFKNLNLTFLDIEDALEIKQGKLVADGVKFVRLGLNDMNISYYAPTFVKLARKAEAAITNCIFTEGGYGIQVQDSGKLDLAYSKIIDNKYIGIEVTGHSRTSINNSSIKGNSPVGISAIGADRLEINSSEISKNSEGGLLISDSSKIFIKNSTISKNSYYGILLRNNGESLIIENDISDNGSGLQVLYGATPKINLNTIQNNRNTGILFKDSSAGTLENNHITNNGQDGVQLTGRAKPTVKDNLIDHNKRFGIHFLGESSAEILQNKITLNARHGIVVSDQAAPNITKNNITQNKEAALVYTLHAGGLATDNTCTGNGLNSVKKYNFTGNADLTHTGCP